MEKLLGWLLSDNKPKQKMVLFHSATAGYKIYTDGSINVYDELKFKQNYHLGKYNEENVVYYNRGYREG